MLVVTARIDGENGKTTRKQRIYSKNPSLKRFEVAPFGFPSCSYSMKWYSYSRRIRRVRVPLELNTSTKTNAFSRASVPRSSNSATSKLARRVTQSNHSTFTFPTEIVPAISSAHRSKSAPLVPETAPQRPGKSRFSVPRTSGSRSR